MDISEIKDLINAISNSKIDIFDYEENGAKLHLEKKTEVEVIASPKPVAQDVLVKQENTEELIKCIMKYLPYGPAFYDEDTITDQPQRQIVAELIREKALRCLDEEIPHGIAVTIEKMKWRKSSKGTIVDIEATIICERESHKGIIIGKQGTMLRKIGQSARRDIEEMLEEKVNLQLWVKVRRDWRDSDLLLKNYGYNPKDNE